MRLILEYAEWLKTLSEKSSDPTAIELDWYGKAKGEMISPTAKFVDGPSKIIGIMEPVGEAGSLTLSFGQKALRGGGWAKQTPPKPTPPDTKKSEPIVIPSVDFKGTDFPFPDNIITPNWEKSTAAKQAFDDMIKNMIAYFSLSEELALKNFG